MPARKKVNKKEGKPVVGPSKAFYRIEESGIGWVLITLELNEAGQVINSNASDEDVLINILHQFERKIKDEFNL